MFRLCINPDIVLHNLFWIKNDKDCVALRHRCSYYIWHTHKLLCCGHDKTKWTKHVLSQAPYFVITTLSWYFKKKILQRKIIKHYQPFLRYNYSQSYIKIYQFNLTLQFINTSIKQFSCFKECLKSYHNCHIYQYETGKDIHNIKWSRYVWYWNCDTAFK